MLPVKLSSRLLNVKLLTSRIPVNSVPPVPERIRGTVALTPAWPLV